MKIIKKILKGVLMVLAIPATYVIVSLILTFITVNSDSNGSDQETIYISTNGVHLDVILAKKDLNESLIRGLKHKSNEQYFSFGWGDRNFYINTPTWGDLTFNNAFRAMFLKSSTLIHLTRYRNVQSDWIEIKISEAELNRINTFIDETFKTDQDGHKRLLPGAGYHRQDDFYEALGSYSCIKTCNSWVNTMFKQCGLKSCLWTPFDFGLINKYQ